MGCIWAIRVGFVYYFKRIILRIKNNNVYTFSCVVHEAIEALTKYVDKDIKNKKYAAGRLVMTEQAYFHSVAQKAAFAELDVEKVEIVATLDSHTSTVCQDMDGKVIDMKDYEPGVTVPPFHVFCRPVTVPYFEDNFTGERAARDKDGNTYYVTDDMTYKDWKKRSVVDAIKDSERKQYENFKSILGNNMPSLEKFIKIKYNKYNWKEFNCYTSSIKSGELSALADFELYQNTSKEMDDKLVGIITSNNVKVEGKSIHSIARVIGSVVQRRNGVRVSDVLDALTNKESEVLPIKVMKNGRSQKFRNDFVEVSINPDTGNIIQVNPFRSRKKGQS